MAEECLEMQEVSKKKKEKAQGDVLELNPKFKELTQYMKDSTIMNYLSDQYQCKTASEILKKEDNLLDLTDLTARINTLENDIDKPKETSTPLRDLTISAIYNYKNKKFAKFQKFDSYKNNGRKLKQRFNRILLLEALCNLCEDEFYYSTKTQKCWYDDTKLLQMLRDLCQPSNSIKETKSDDTELKPFCLLYTWFPKSQFFTKISKASGSSVYAQARSGAISVRRDTLDKAASPFKKKNYEINKSKRHSFDRKVSTRKEQEEGAKIAETQVNIHSEVSLSYDSDAVDNSSNNDNNKHPNIKNPCTQP